MTCNYRIVLVMDGGDDALLVPLIGLNYLAGHLHTVDLERSLVSWVDMLVASGDAVLLASLLAEGKSAILKDTFQLEDFIKHQNNGYSAAIASDFFSEHTVLRDLKKHFLLLSYDVDEDQLFYFTDTNPLLQNLTIRSALKACMGNPMNQEFVKLGSKRLANASSFLPNPIQQAAHLASCLYHNEPVVFVSIGSGITDELSMLHQAAEKEHNNFFLEVKNERNWHYFRFNPVFESSASIEDKIHQTRHYFENIAPNMDRLLRLMELKAGRIL